MVFLRKGYETRLDATVEVAAPVSVVNASLPFADPIAPGFVEGGFIQHPAWDVGSPANRKRLLDAMARDAQRLGLYDDDF